MHAAICVSSYGNWMPLTSSFDSLRENRFAIEGDTLSPYGGFSGRIQTADSGVACLRSPVSRDWQDYHKGAAKYRHNEGANLLTVR